MRALVTRGKFKGKVFEVSQWCNDWFTLDPRNDKTLTDKQVREVMTKPFSPTSLAFSIGDYNEICEHNNNGFLFDWYEPVVTNKSHPTEPYVVIFTKRK